MSRIEELAQPRMKRLKPLSDSFMDPFRYLKALLYFIGFTCYLI